METFTLPPRLSAKPFVNPEYVYAYGNLGIVFYKQGKKAEAEDYCSRALAMDENQMDVLYYYGAVIAGKRERLKRGEAICKNPLKKAIKEAIDWLKSNK